jgi:NTP pyrophosphatase (non-canonical NTP hydrolase)
LYFRTVVFPELANEVEACRRDPRLYGSLTVDAYQMWNEFGWKRPHATFQAADRFAGKLREEHAEVDDALEEYYDTLDPTHLVEELGDFAWVATGVANNGGAVIGDGLKRRAYEYAMGTRQYINGIASYPEWYDAAGALAIKKGPVTLGDIDDLLDAGFVPQPSPTYNILEDEPVSAIGYVFDLQMYGAAMRSLNAQQYPYGEDGRSDRTTYEQAAQRLGNAAAEIYFRVAYIAKYAGKDLTTVMATNVDKISDRVATGSVDRTDGVRALQQPLL